MLAREYLVQYILQLETNMMIYVLDIQSGKNRRYSVGNILLYEHNKKWWKASPTQSLCKCM